MLNRLSTSKGYIVNDEKENLEYVESLLIDL
jgi:hypothetical protein